MCSDDLNFYCLMQCSLSRTFYQVCSHCSCLVFYFSLPCRSSQSCDVLGLQRGNSNLERLFARPLTSSLPCWKIQPHFIFSALIDRSCLAKIPPCTAAFILLLAHSSCPLPSAEKQPQSTMFPPPGFTAVSLGCNSAFFLLQTRRVALIPESSTLVSSDRFTFFLLWIIHKVSGKLETGRDVCCFIRGTF